MAALVLVRFLVALPSERSWRLPDAQPPAGAVAAAGMVLAAFAFVLMSRWDLTSCPAGRPRSRSLVGGFGFGLALAPVNAAVLAAPTPTCTAWPAPASSSRG
jgi:hypothetical protein